MNDKHKPRKSLRTDAMYEAAARWENATAMETLLAPLPAYIVAEIRRGHAKFPKGFCGMRHDAESGQAFYINADAMAIQVWTLPPCSEQHAAEMWAIIDDGPRPITTALIRRAFSDVTGDRWTLPLTTADAVIQWAKNHDTSCGELATFTLTKRPDIDGAEGVYACEGCGDTVVVVLPFAEVKAFAALATQLVDTDDRAIAAEIAQKLAD